MYIRPCHRTKDGNPSSELFIAEHYYQSTAMPERFEKRIDEALEKVQASCLKSKWNKEVVRRQLALPFSDN